MLFQELQRSLYWALIILINTTISTSEMTPLFCYRPLLVSLPPHPRFSFLLSSPKFFFCQQTDFDLLTQQTDGAVELRSDRSMKTGIWCLLPVLDTMLRIYGESAKSMPHLTPAYEQAPVSFLSRV